MRRIFLSAGLALLALAPVAHAQQGGAAAVPASDALEVMLLKISASSRCADGCAVRGLPYSAQRVTESVKVLAFLMSRPQTAAVKAAVQGALAWYRSPAVQVANTAYVSRPSGSTDDKYNPIVAKAGSTMWYRFYDLDADVGFFSGRSATDNPPGAGKRYNLMDIEAERRYGYQWGGSYGTAILKYAESVGY